MDRVGGCSARPARRTTMTGVPSAVRSEPLPVITESRRTDAWWVEPLIVVAVLGGFGLYSLWVAVTNANYWVDPYLSPYYSPCIAANCRHVTLPIIGSWWNLSPAFLVFWVPLGFRATCYYYRRSYYRAFFWAPPACAIPDARARYGGETRFPYIFQNAHRYFFYLSILIVLFLWIDALKAFVFPTGFGIGLGTVVLVANVALLSLYTFSCHSCRHLCGGHLDAFKSAPRRYRVWRLVSQLNERHGFYAW